MDDYPDSASALDFAGGRVAGQAVNFSDAVATDADWRGETLLQGNPGEVVLCAKRLLDVMLAALLLAMLSPLLLLVSLALLAGGGPVFFVQDRIGYHGRVFGCYKFRTMMPRAEQVLQELLRSDERAREEWRRAQKLQHDPRITRLGELLRRSSIDELPQLVNVLRGEMSLVGPRPAMVDQLPLYGAQAACYTSMRPGITGLWQVTARGDPDFARRIALDCEYVRRFSLLGDLLILGRTIRVVMSGSGAY